MSHIPCHSHQSRVTVKPERFEWHQRGENESRRKNEGQESHLLHDPTEKTAWIAESSLGLAKGLGISTSRSNAASNWG